MKELATDEAIALATFRESIEWETVEGVIQRQINSLEGQLGDSNFERLDQLTAIQGERRGLKWFLRLVERAHKDSLKE